MNIDRLRATLVEIAALGGAVPMPCSDDDLRRRALGTVDRLVDRHAQTHQRLVAMRAEVAEAKAQRDAALELARRLEATLNMVGVRTRNGNGTRIAALCNTHRRPLRDCTQGDTKCSRCGCGGHCDTGWPCPRRVSAGADAHA